MARINWKKGAVKAASVAGAILVWYLATCIVGENLLLPSPIDVAARLATLPGDGAFLSRVWFSFSRIVGGFLLALPVGCVLAVLAGRFSAVETVLWPYMVTVKSVPVASFIILALMAFSSATLSVFISFLMVLPVVYSNILGGVKSIDPAMTEMAEAFHLSFFKRLGYVWIPHIKPFLLSACSLSLGLAFKAGIAAEVIGLPRGSIGEALYESKAWFLTEDLFAWTVVIVLISVGFEKLFVALVRGGYALWEKR